MKHLISIFLVPLIALFLIFNGCSGSDGGDKSDTANTGDIGKGSGDGSNLDSNLTKITGKIANSSFHNKIKVIAINNGGDVYKVNDTDGAFAISVVVGHFYKISFLNTETSTFLGNLVSEDSRGINSEVFFIPSPDMGSKSHLPNPMGIIQMPLETEDGETTDEAETKSEQNSEASNDESGNESEIDLGNVDTSEDGSTPPSSEKTVAEQVDSDGDGINDLYDEDADNNGIEDNNQKSLQHEVTDKKGNKKKVSSDDAETKTDAIEEEEVKEEVGDKDETLKLYIKKIAIDEIEIKLNKDIEDLAADVTMKDAQGENVDIEIKIEDDEITIIAKNESLEFAVGKYVITIEIDNKSFKLEGEVISEEDKKAKKAKKKALSEGKSKKDAEKAAQKAKEEESKLQRILNIKPNFFENLHFEKVRESNEKHLWRVMYKKEIDKNNPPEKPVKIINGEKSYELKTEVDKKKINFWFSETSLNDLEKDVTDAGSDGLLLQMIVTSLNEKKEVTGELSIYVKEALEKKDKALKEDAKEQRQQKKIEKENKDKTDGGAEDDGDKNDKGGKDKADGGAEDDGDKNDKDGKDKADAGAENGAGKNDKDNNKGNGGKKE